MKKVLVVITTAFVEFGGLTTVAMNYYRFMDKTGLNIDFASTNTPDSVLTNELHRFGSRYYNLGSRKNIIIYRRNLKRLIEKNEYDVIHIHSNSATAVLELQIAKQTKVCQRIIHIHNSTCSHMKLHHVLKPYFDKAYTRAVACSYKAGEWIFPRGKFTVLNNAIDTKRYHYSEEYRSIIRNELGLENAFVIGHVGKINEQKNHHFLLEVFRTLYSKDPEAILLLVGDGPLRSELETEAKALGISERVLFLGIKKDIEKYLSAMDVFVFPSLWEGLPLSLVEAEASGLKCVTSDKVTQEANVTGSVIYLPLNDSMEWSEKILHLRGYDRVKECHKNLSAICEKSFDIRKNASILREIYLS